MGFYSISISESSNRDKAYELSEQLGYSRVMFGNKWGKASQRIYKFFTSRYGDDELPAGEPGTEVAQSLAKEFCEELGQGAELWAPSRDGLNTGLPEWPRDKEKIIALVAKFFLLPRRSAPKDRKRQSTEEIHEDVRKHNETTSNGSLAKGTSARPSMLNPANIARSETVNADDVLNKELSFATHLSKIKSDFLDAGKGLTLLWLNGKKKWPLGTLHFIEYYMHESDFYPSNITELGFEDPNLSSLQALLLQQAELLPSHEISVKERFVFRLKNRIDASFRAFLQGDIIIPSEGVHPYQKSPTFAKVWKSTSWKTGIPSKPTTATTVWEIPDDDDDQILVNPKGVGRQDTRKDTRVQGPVASSHKYISPYIEALQEEAGPSKSAVKESSSCNTPQETQISPTPAVSNSVPKMPILYTDHPKIPDQATNEAAIPSQHSEEISITSSAETCVGRKKQKTDHGSDVQPPQPISIYTTNSDTATATSTSPLPNNQKGQPIIRCGLLIQDRVNINFVIQRFLANGSVETSQDYNSDLLLLPQLDEFFVWYQTESMYPQPLASLIFRFPAITTLPDEEVDRNREDRFAFVKSRIRDRVRRWAGKRGDSTLYFTMEVRVPGAVEEDDEW